MRLAVIGLIVLGPERLPAVARTLGGFVRKARISYHNLKRTVEAELAAADAANPIKDAQKELESVQRQVNELRGQLDQDVAPNLVPEADKPLLDQVSAETAAPDAPEGEEPDPDTPADTKDRDAARSSGENAA